MNQDVETALAMARKFQPSEKVPMSVKAPKDIHDEFQTLCKAEQVSMNRMIVSLMTICVVGYQPTVTDQDDKTPPLPGMDYIHE